MQHPTTSSVWQYQTDDEQQTLLELYAEFELLDDERLELDERVRRVRSRAFMRRARGSASFQLDYFLPRLSQ